MSPQANVDELDHAIIDALRLDGRRSIRDLAAELDVPETTVRDHIHRLEQGGAIVGHRPIIDGASLGITESAWVYARCGEDQRDDIVSKLSAHAQVLSSRMMGGDPEQFMLRVVGTKVSSIAQVLEHSLTLHDFRVKTIVPIDRVLQHDSGEPIHWTPN